MTLTPLPPNRPPGRFRADPSPNRGPDQAARAARAGFAGTVGAIIAGRGEDSARIMTGTPVPCDGAATLAFGVGHVPVAATARSDGTAAHAPGRDDAAMGASPIPAGIPFARPPAIKSIDARDLIAAA